MGFFIFVNKQKQVSYDVQPASRPPSPTGWVVGG